MGWTRVGDHTTVGSYRSGPSFCASNTPGLAYALHPSLSPLLSSQMFHTPGLAHALHPSMPPGFSSQVCPKTNSRLCSNSPQPPHHSYTAQAVPLKAVNACKSNMRCIRPRTNGRAGGHLNGRSDERASKRTDELTGGRTVKRKDVQADGRSVPTVTNVQSDRQSGGRTVAREEEQDVHKRSDGRSGGRAVGRTVGRTYERSDARSAQRRTCQIRSDERSGGRWTGGQAGRRTVGRTMDVR